ncbi:MAG: beta-glucuronidase, partial [Flavobacteriaceae bacterium]
MKTDIHYKKFLNLAIITLLFCMYSYGQHETEQIDLSGTWQFKIDSHDRGVSEKWYSKNLSETIEWPGSMAENGKGNEITVNSKWTGKIVDSTWFYDEKYAKYRKPGNVKIPYWLQPEKHYIGAAWYQKEVEIPSVWDGKHIELTLERPHWETQVWVDDRHLGMQNSLGTAHIYDLTDYLKPGKNIISIRVDNRVKDVHPGENSHSISDHTQSNWNGIVGEIKLNATAPVIIENVKLYPDVANKKVTVIAQVKNFSGKAQKCQLVIKAVGLGENKQAHEQVVREIEVDSNGQFEIDYPMGKSPLLWDEFNPNLYAMELSLKSPSGIYKEQVTFGMREFKAEGKRFAVNGRPVFLRGTLECAIFPLTGYPPTDVDEWKRILKIVQNHG